jgi:predicted RNA binding protein YcfA (HicA-like mRNA interferase family)
MKCIELLRILESHRWIFKSQKWPHLKLKHPEKEGMIIFPNKGSKD